MEKAKGKKHLLGIKLQAKPTKEQRSILSLWMGCAKFIWNAKCEEERYYSTFASKFCPIGTFAPIDQKYSHFKDKELSPWLFSAPSQILRNSASNWYKTYFDFIMGKCGKPKRKPKSDQGSVHLTSELFRFEQCNGTFKLFIGTKTNNIGYLKIKVHKKFKIPSSIYIKKKNGEYWVAFCYENDKINYDLLEQEQHLQYLSNCSEKFLTTHTVGIDRGVNIPVQCSNAGESFDFTAGQKKNKARKEKNLKRYQRRMAKQQKNSNRRKSTKHKIGKCHKKITNIREDFCHKTSHAIVSNENNKIIILENLKTKNLTKKPKAKKNAEGKWEKNGAKAKAGLNKAILDKCWYKLEKFIQYKAYNACKAYFKISPNYTSQECANCGHTHRSNRKSQSQFHCDGCGHVDNADKNAAEVIKKRAIKLILYSGTELSKGGTLLDTGRGATYKTVSVNAGNASGNETSKKKSDAKLLV